MIADDAPELLEPDEIEWLEECLDGAAEQGELFFCEAVFARRLAATLRAELTPPRSGGRAA